MMRRLREIPCRMLARTALQPRVLVALIQCATMTTEVVEVTTESEVASHAILGELVFLPSSQTPAQPRTTFLSHCYIRVVSDQSTVLK